MAFGYSPKGTDQNIAFFQIDSPVLDCYTGQYLHLYDPSGISLAILVHDIDCYRVISRFFGPFTYFFSNSKWLTEQNKLKSTEMFVCRINICL